jgi:hypothetical protein
MRWSQRIVVPASVRRRAAHGLRGFNARKVDHPPLDPALRARLQADFLPEVERLSQVLDRDLTHWCREHEA